MTTALTLLILAGAGLYAMGPDERVRLGRALLARARDAIRTVTLNSPSTKPFGDALRARTRWAILTPSLLALNVVIFTFMLFAAGAPGDAQTLVEWGGNFAPRTTNGEWHRLAAAMFVHGGVLHLLATLGGLVAVGAALERTVGPVAFATIFGAAGIAANVTGLWTAPAMHVGVGASGAIFGLYGLLLATLVWAFTGRSSVPTPLPLGGLAWCGALAALFVLFNLRTDHLGTPGELAGLATGVVGGLVLTRGISREKPPARRAAAAMAAALVFAAIGAVPLRGVADVRPEIARVGEMEARMARAYDAAVLEFRKGWINAPALAQLIDGTIMPEVEAARARVAALRGVPREHAPLIAAAEEYFELRQRSWRLRMEGLRGSNGQMLRDAEESERAALTALRRVSPPTG